MHSDDEDYTPSAPTTTTTNSAPPPTASTTTTSTSTPQRRQPLSPPKPQSLGTKPIPHNHGGGSSSDSDEESATDEDDGDDDDGDEEEEDVDDDEDDDDDDEGPVTLRKSSTGGVVCARDDVVKTPPKKRTKKDWCEYKDWRVEGTQVATKGRDKFFASYTLTPPSGAKNRASIVLQPGNIVAVWGNPAPLVIEALVKQITGSNKFTFFCRKANTSIGKLESFVHPNSRAQERRISTRSRQRSLRFGTGDIIKIFNSKPEPGHSTAKYLERTFPKGRLDSAVHMVAQKRPPPPSPTSSEPVSPPAPKKPNVSTTPAAASKQGSPLSSTTSKKTPSSESPRNTASSSVPGPSAGTSPSHRPPQRSAELVPEDMLVLSGNAAHLRKNSESQVALAQGNVNQLFSMIRDEIQDKLLEGQQRMQQQMIDAQKEMQQQMIKAQKAMHKRMTQSQEHITALIIKVLEHRDTSSTDNSP
ncbi:hypothetical protein Pelo_8411 [Pelomyxa schiedti]|nr:hypothetical protein Pelo_8411 [Pelomyxa schiedti]